LILKRFSKKIKDGEEAETLLTESGTKPLRWTFYKGLIDKNSTRGFTLFSGDKRKREILAPIAASAAFRAVWNDDEIKLANMLAAFLYFVHDW